MKTRSRKQEAHIFISHKHFTEIEQICINGTLYNANNVYIALLKIQWYF